MSFGKIVSIAFMASAIMFLARPSSAADLPGFDAAVEPLTNENPLPAWERMPSALQAEKSLDFLKKRGSFLIFERQLALDKLLKRATTSRISAAQKSEINAEVGKEKSSLWDLDKKIKAATSSQEAKALIKSIYVDHRIFAVFVPRVELAISLFVKENYADILAGQIKARQLKLDSARASSSISSSSLALWQQSLNDASSSLVSAKKKIDRLQADNSNIKPSDHPDSHRQELSAVRQGIKNVSRLFEDVRYHLKHKAKYLRSSSKK